MEAGRMLILLQPKTKELATQKGFLTDADLKSEEMILKILGAVYPEIHSFSEEKGGEAIKEGLVWVIDPVDGTINFFLGDDHWGVSIALVEDGHAIAGVVYLPAKGKMFSATSVTHGVHFQNHFCH